MKPLSTALVSISIIIIIHHSSSFIIIITIYFNIIMHHFWFVVNYSMRIYIYIYIINTTILCYRHEITPTCKSYCRWGSCQNVGWFRYAHWGIVSLSMKKGIVITMVQITHPSRSNYFLLYESILSIYLIFYRFICHNLSIYYKLLDTSLYPFIYLYIYTYTHIFIHIYLCITISVYRRSTQFCCIITH
jgi:hypothetical protein